MKKQGKNEGNDIPGQKEKMGGSHVYLYTFLDRPHFLRGQKKTVTGSLEGRGPGEPGKQVAGCSPKQLWEASRKRCHERRWREGRQRAGCVQRPSFLGPSTGSGGGSLASESGSLSATPSPAGAAEGHGLTSYQETDFCSWAGTAWLGALASHCSLCPWFAVFKVRVQSLCPIGL